MLIIGSYNMYDSTVSMQESNGNFQLVDTENNVLFSSSKVAHANKALRYVNEQELAGNGVLIDLIAPAVFDMSVVFNSDVYSSQQQAELTTTLTERGIKPIFLSEQIVAGQESLLTAMEAENEEEFARDIDERIAIGFSETLVPDRYTAMEYQDFFDYIGTNAPHPIVQQEKGEPLQNAQPETKSEENKAEENPVLTPQKPAEATPAPPKAATSQQKEAQLLYHIETKDRSYTTTDLVMSQKPNRKGVYFINDAEGKGIFGSKNKASVEKILAFAKEKAAAGEVISTKELKRLEFQPKQEEKTTDSLSDEYDTIKKSVKNIESLEKKIEQERKKVQEQIKQLKSNNAPAEIISMAESIMKQAEQTPVTPQKGQEKPVSNKKDFLPLTQEEKADAYVTFRLENKLLTRSNASLKAGAVNAFDKLREPLRKLREISLTRKIRKLTKDTLKMQRDLIRYQQKLAPKMPRRLEHANKQRIRNGQEPFAAGTPVYSVAEQEKIDGLTVFIDAYTKRINLLHKQIENSQEKHRSRINYVREQRSISNNETITENHKKVFYQFEKLSGSEVPPVSPLEPEAEANATQEPAENEPVPSEPIPDASEGAPVIPSDDFDEPVPPLPPDDYCPVIEEPPVDAFSNLSDRFNAAAQEAAKAKDLSNAHLLYLAIEVKLPANGYIEFEANGNSFTAQKDEVGELTLKKYNYETGLHDEISSGELIDFFKEDTKAFEAVLKEHLGEPSSQSKTKDSEITTDSHGTQ